MRHYCKNCSNASVWKENDDGSRAYTCGICHAWITAISPTGIMDHCTGWFWKGWRKLTCIGAITVFTLCIGAMSLIIASNIMEMI